MRTGRQTTTKCSSGAIRRRSPASLVTTACPARRAHTTTWASTMSAVAVRARRRPTAVASGPSSAIRSVPDCRMRRERRDCLAGFRMACARAVAGIVIRMPSSDARARSVRAWRSFRSSAISPPVSKVMPFTQPSLFRNSFWAAAEREARRPKRAPSSSTGHRFVAGHLQASPSIRRHRKEQLQPRASQTQKHWRPFPLPQVRASLQPDRPEV